ncbi:MAG: ATP synthase subunit C [Blautia sp.]|nr:ATP synthase subunit C [Blautia sp.]MDY4516804.1 ATP synthase subunit C [Lachnospiraceae bacterium]
MTTLVSVTLIIALVLSIIVPFGAFLIGERNRGRYKTSLAVNCFFFFGTLILANIIAFTGDGSVAAAAGEAASEASGLATGMGYLAAALVTGLSCIGGGIAVASAASAALGAISEDQSILGKSLIFVGLAEGVALYGLIISFMILGKLG